MSAHRRFIISFLFLLPTPSPCPSLQVTQENGAYQTLQQNIAPCLTVWQYRGGLGDMGHTLNKSDFKRSYWNQALLITSCQVPELTVTSQPHARSALHAMSIMWLLLPKQRNTPRGQHSIHRAELPLLHPQCHQAMVTVVFTPVSVCTLLSLPLACLFWLARKKICWHRGDPFSGLITLVVSWEAGRGNAGLDQWPLDWTSDPWMEGTWGQCPSQHMHTPSEQNQFIKWHQLSQSLV